jgi:hypothetical protein
MTCLLAHYVPSFDLFLWISNAATRTLYSTLITEADISLSI